MKMIRKIIIIVIELQLINGLIYFQIILLVPNSRNKMKIDIEQGTLEGLECNTKLSNKPYFRFLGIPYAKPPINDLRFKVSN